MSKDKTFYSLKKIENFEKFKNKLIEFLSDKNGESVIFSNFKIILYREEKIIKWNINMLNDGEIEINIEQLTEETLKENIL